MGKFHDELWVVYKYYPGMTEEVFVTDDYDVIVKNLELTHKRITVPSIDFIKRAFKEVGWNGDCDDFAVDVIFIPGYMSFCDHGEYHYHTADENFSYILIPSYARSIFKKPEDSSSKGHFVEEVNITLQPEEVLKQAFLA